MCLYSFNILHCIARLWIEKETIDAFGSNIRKIACHKYCVGFFYIINA